MADLDLKPVLDVCCGGKMFYFNKTDPRVFFCDNREVETTLCDGRYFEIKPDLKCDFTNLPFEDNTFRLVVFDPPHLIRASGKEPTGWQQIKYGALNNDWPKILADGFKECFRVLIPGGFLIFKWNETDIPVKKVLACTDETPIFGHKSGKRSNTHWICFMKPEEINNQED